MPGSHLQNLNHAQLRAVQHPPSIPLQILAGPGSGKTKVLTARIANLISEHNIPPYAICAVTFTNKAASEMRERLTKLIGKAQTSQIKMGTFHALCATFLRRYPRLVGVEGNFTVCDADESKKIVKKLLEKYKQFLVERDISLKEATVLSMISKAKAKGRSAIDLQEEHLNRDNRSSITAEIDRVVAEIYGEYERILRRNNSLDFDDLLVFGVKLFSGHRKVGLWCQHVLVDEFQDTNTVQYELMKCIAAANKCVTIVGDPDQSIYGWRSAEIENLERMQKDFPTTQQIFLEQNYRSTASILAASMAIVSQDNTRVPKTLRTSCPTGPTPVLQSFPYDNNEAAFIAAEIKRLVAVTGGMLGWGDFVILLRFNALSRSIESALQKEGIPNRVLAGHKFFDRLEVKDILAYLQFVDNPHFAPAFSRAINVPGRSIGEKTISELLSAAQRLQISPFEVVQRIYDGKTPDIKPPVKRKLASFLPPLRELRKLAQSGMQPPDLIRRFLDLIDYKSHLMKTQPDWESRWDNVQELINYASEVEITASSQQRDYDDVSDGEWDVLEEYDRDQVEDVPETRVQSDKGKGKATSEGAKDTPLRLFLQASMLSTDTETQGDDGKEKVTIATCHAAKGLEWPVVMIPAVEKGTFPSSRAEDIHEERRLLYVACTRAQGLLYLSYSTARMVSGEVKRKEPSDFLLPLHGQDLFSNQTPNLTPSDRVLLANLLGRPPPSEPEVVRRVSEHHRTAKQNSWGYSDQSHNSLSERRNWSQHSAPIPQAATTFRSTKESFPTALHQQSLPDTLPRSQPLSPSRAHAVNISSGRMTQPRVSPASGSLIRSTLRNVAAVSTAVAGRLGSLTGPSVSVQKQRVPPRPQAQERPSKLSTTQAASLRRHEIIDLTLAPPSSHSSTSDSSPATASPATTSPALMATTSSIAPPAGTKRRLGMGRTGGGYANKKFKTPGANS